MHYDKNTNTPISTGEALTIARRNGYSNTEQGAIELGFWHVIEVTVPEGYVIVEGSRAYTVAIDGSQTVTETADLETVAARDARLAQAQAVADCQKFGDRLAQLVQALAPFNTITPGMTYAETMNAMKAELEATVDFAAYKAKDIAMTEASKAFERYLEPEGISGDRLWMALAALQLA